MQRRKRREAEGFANPALMPNLVTARPGLRRHVPPALLLRRARRAGRRARPPAAHGRLARARGDGDDGHRHLGLDERHRRRAEPHHGRRQVRQAADRRAARDVPARPRHVLGLRRAARGAVDRPLRGARRARPADGRRRHRDGARARARAGGGAHAGRRTRTAPARGGCPRCSCCSPTARTRRAASARSRSPQRARKAGIPIYAIALGTPDGEVEVQDSFGLTTRIQVPPDTETLKEIARVSRGRFYEAADSAKLEEIYAGLGTQAVLQGGQGGGHRGLRRRRAPAAAARRHALHRLVRPPDLGVSGARRAR